MCLKISLLSIGKNTSEYNAVSGGFLELYSAELASLEKTPVENGLIYCRPSARLNGIRHDLPATVGK